MAAAYALISILSAAGGIVALWPSMGWWSLASVWPVGCLSCLLSAVLVGVARSRYGRGELDELADAMVSDLRGVLARAEARVAPPAHAPFGTDARRAAS